MTDAAKDRIKSISSSTLVPISMVLAMILGVWTLRGSIAKFEESLNSQLTNLNMKLDGMDKLWQWHMKSDWTRADMERWSYLLERSNRGAGLVVPDPGVVRNTRSEP